MTPVARQRTPTLEVRDALLRAARELLAEQGPEALAIRDIATRAGVSPMGVYNRFGSKDGILDALTSQGFAELAGSLAGIPDEPVAAIAAGMATYRAFALANPAIYRLMFDRPMTRHAPAGVDSSGAADTFHRLADRVRLDTASGLLRPGDPEEIAHRIWAACHGAISLELLGNLFVTDRDAHYTALVHTILRGLATHPRQLG